MSNALYSALRRECIIGLRRFARHHSSIPHHISSTFPLHGPKFASFFNQNNQWASVVHPPASSRLASETVEDVLEERWRRPSDLALGPPSQAITTYPPPMALTPYRPVQVLTLKRLLGVYVQLSKSRLTVLVVLTAMSSVALSPLPTSVPVLLATALGTALCSASANTLNQIQEVPFDAQMARTRNRPLVRHAISPLHAAGFALVTGVSGPMILWTCTNATTALLGAGTIMLYAGVYTYLKRRSVVNTWVGAVVGALPPLMGWTACQGHLLPSDSYPVHFFLPSFLLPSEIASLPAELANNPLAPLALFIVLFSWQFPHFNSLSHLVRSSYAQAGYHMLSVSNPALNTVVALRHALLLIPVCSILIPLSGLTTWMFAVTSFLPNTICARYAWAFWRRGGEKEARKLWYACLWQLPVIMGLMMVHKNGLEWVSWFRTDEDVEKAEVAMTSVNSAPA